MDYEVDRDRIRYGAKAVRGAEVESFEVLLRPWARDRSSVYLAGRKVSRARPGTFRALAATVGCDEKRIFHADFSGHIFDSAYSRSDGFDPATARVVEQDGRTFLISQRVWVLRGHLLGLGLDPKSFEPLGRGYCRDQTKLVWVRDDGYPRNIEGADLATFVVDASGVYDRHGRFVSGARDTTLLPVQAEADPRAAATRLIEGLWQECLLKWFADFDLSLVTDHGIARVGSPPATPTPIPPHQLHIDGARLILEVGERRCEATVSGMELLAGWLDGIARGKILGDHVCVRVMLRTDGEIVSTEGTPPRWQRCVDLAYLFEKLELRQEALFLLQRVQRWKPTPFTGAAVTPNESAAVRSEKLLGALLAQLPPEAIPKGSTTQSAMAWVVDNALHRSRDPLVRRDIASSIGALAQQTMIDRARLTALAGPALCLLDDPEPAVRAEAFASFDFLGSQAFNKPAYQEALGVVEALCARGVNLDMQNARRSECLAALGRQREADEAWQACRQLTANDPLLTPTVSSSYSGFAAWREASKARLARWRPLSRATT